ncbi:DHHW family protein [Acidaminobacter hydrogenoformans]|uniref:DHHW protein n=1 Tax=Acidaminobacter hydrogenoformans DSM 2784 TaxID=1120920 RepID=A0A1G5S5X5_9FIRM|nr:DHHW family protein [Acidaminobacter hydrogenoformans]SCZ81131.1 DHHW protein [Acidaminobacter hydrogenoformans DSM 2784]
MNDKTKNKAVTSIFIFFFAVAALLIVLHEQNETSENERRKLSLMPRPSIENMLSTEYMTDFDKYALDQFPFRDNFRELKAITQFYVFQQKDNNGIYITNDTVSKIEYPLKESSVVDAAKKLSYIYDFYLANENTNVFFSIIPDKNYFSASENGYPAMDYDKLVALMQENIDNMKYINIFDCLSIEDYYATDTHWRQERLSRVVERIAAEMRFLDRLKEEFTINKFSPFYGVYYGQAALPIVPETLYYLTTDIIDNSKVYNYETSKYTGVYDINKLDSSDPYEMFLSGAVPLLTIENPKAQTNKELVIFRDSFGSSIAPHFVEAYSKVTLIDIRYITSDYLGSFITFDDQDVLFLYSTLVLNNSTMLK